MATLTISSVTFPDKPTIGQVATISHRLTSDPDVAGSYTTDVTGQAILINGELNPSFTITSLQNETSYTIWITTGCASYKQSITTPAPLCSDITAITGNIS